MNKSTEVDALFYRALTDSTPGLTAPDIPFASDIGEKGSDSTLEHRLSSRRLPHSTELFG
jgi:hypothetical protein